MKARIGLGAIDVLQLLQQRLTIFDRKILLAILSQTQDQGPPNRYVGFLIQALDDGLGVGTQRTQPMDQIAPHSRIGTVLQPSGQLYRLRWLVHSQKSHGCIGLPLCQLLTVVVRGRQFRWQLLVDLSDQQGQSFLTTSLELRVDHAESAASHRLSSADRPKPAAGRRHSRQGCSLPVCVPIPDHWGFHRCFSATPAAFP